MIVLLDQHRSGRRAPRAWPGVIDMQARRRGRPIRGVDSEGRPSTPAGQRRPSYEHAHPPPGRRRRVLEDPRVEVAERPVDRAQPVGQRGRAGPVAGVEQVGQLVHPGRVRAARSRAYPAAVSWLTMNAQSLDSASSASRASWSSTGSRTGPRCASSVDSSRSCTPLAASTRSCTAGPSQTRQSLPEPQDDRPSVDRRPDVAGLRRAAQRGHPHARPPAAPAARPPARPGPRATSARTARCRTRPRPAPAARPGRRAARSRASTVSTKSAASRRTAAAARSGSHGFFRSGGTCRPVTRAGRNPEAWSKVWKSR